MTCALVAASPSASQPVAAPTTGSRFRKAPASSADTRAWPKAKSQNGSGVPATASATSAMAEVGPAGPCGSPSVSSDAGKATSAPPANWTAVTAAASRPASNRGWTTMKPADTTADPRTIRSPWVLAPPPADPATSAMPTSATAYPAHVSGRVAVCPSPAPIRATNTGIAPITTAAWLTLVCSIPTFCSRITAPNPIAPEATMGPVSASRRPRRPTSARTGAATAKRATVTQPGPSHASASLVRGTFNPHRVAAATRQMIAVRC